MSNKKEGAITLVTKILSGASALRIMRDESGGVQEAFIHTPYVARGFQKEDLNRATQLLETGFKEPMAASF